MCWKLLYNCFRCLWPPLGFVLNFLMVEAGICASDEGILTAFCHSQKVICSQFLKKDVAPQENFYFREVATYKEMRLVIMYCSLPDPKSNTKRIYEVL